MKNRSVREILADIEVKMISYFNLKSEGIDDIEQNLKEKRRVSFREWFGFGVGLVSLLIAIFTWTTANSITQNSAPTRFEFTKIEAVRPDYTEGVAINLEDHDRLINLADINISIKMHSGQISNMYIVTQKNGYYFFELLNDKSVLTSGFFKKTYRFTKNIQYDVERLDYQLNGRDTGAGYIYLLYEDAAGSLDIDVIQIIGSITYDTINLAWDFVPNYKFRYIKNRYLVSCTDFQFDESGELLTKESVSSWNYLHKDEEPALSQIEVDFEYIEKMIKNIKTIYENSY